MLLVRRHTTAIPALIVVSLIISNFYLDRITTGSTTEQAQDCYSSAIVGEAPRLCHPVTNTVTTSGRPFTALRQYESPPSDIANSHREEPVDAVPITNNGGLYISLNAVLVFLILFAVYIFYSRHQSTIDNLAPDIMDAAADADGPIIESSNLLNGGDVVSADKGEKNGYAYNLMVNEGGRTMSLVTLPQDTGLHVIAIGEKSSLGLALTEKIDKHFLAKVTLEGDFPDYFKLYCTPDKEVEIRELLDPATMQYLVDTCQTYDLEIFKDSLFLSKAANAPEDGSSVVAITEDFIVKFTKVLNELVDTPNDVENAENV